MPSHAYTFPFAPNPDWARLLASSQDIMQYIKDVVDCLAAVGSMWYSLGRLVFRLAQELDLLQLRYMRRSEPVVLFVMADKIVRLQSCCLGKHWRWRQPLFANAMVLQWRKVLFARVSEVAVVHRGFYLPLRYTMILPLALVACANYARRASSVVIDQ